MFRADPQYRVVAFTAAQIPNIAGRSYPPELAGALYPVGIPIVPDKRLDKVIQACASSKRFMSSGMLLVGGDGPERGPPRAR